MCCAVIEDSAARHGLTFEPDAPPTYPPLTFHPTCVTPCVKVDQGFGPEPYGIVSGAGHERDLRPERGPGRRMYFVTAAKAASAITEFEQTPRRLIWRWLRGVVGAMVKRPWGICIECRLATDSGAAVAAFSRQKLVHVWLSEDALLRIERYEPGGESYCHCRPAKARGGLRERRKTTLVVR